MSGRCARYPPRRRRSSHWSRRPAHQRCAGGCLCRHALHHQPRSVPHTKPVNNAYVTPTNPGTLWIDTARRRYIPARGDPVVGIITERYADTYHVHINATFVAQLPVLAFDGATRRNRPNLNVCKAAVVCDSSHLARMWCTDADTFHDTRCMPVAACNLPITFLHPTISRWAMWCTLGSNPATRTLKPCSAASTHTAKTPALVHWLLGTLCGSTQHMRGDC